MVVNGKELLLKARDEHYALGAFNVMDYNTVEMVLAAAEELGTPVMIQTGDYAGPETPEARRMTPFAAENLLKFIRMRAEASSVPVVIHLDHCPSFEGCIRAIQAGATSVMLDASQEPFEVNVARTKEVVRAAHACGVCVEAEIGHVTGHANSHGALYTEVEDAVRFYEETGVDLLAVSIGTVHGIYTEAPVLNYQRIKELRDAIPAPLVMHGSSGLTPDQYRDTIQNGICKVNFATYLLMNAGNAIKQACIDAGDKPCMVQNLNQIGINRGIEYVKEHIGYFGTKKA